MKKYTEAQRKLLYTAYCQGNVSLKRRRSATIQPLIEACLIVTDGTDAELTELGTWVAHGIWTQLRAAGRLL